MEHEINSILEELKGHPFNIIGLADREKFHTGMLAFLFQRLRSADKEHFSTLVQTIWTNSAKHLPAESLEIKVEQKGIDLAILQGKSVTHWAEMKLKTGLARDQIQRYEERHPHAQSVLLGLFPESTGSDRTEFRSFPKLVSEFHQGDRLKLLNGTCSSDEITLLRMWVEYLDRLHKLSNIFVEQGLRALPTSDTISKGLNALKLRGIFERYRYYLVLEQIRKPIEGLGIEVELFNSNGNAGLDIPVDEDRSFGLQWQAGSLKLFMIQAGYRKGDETPERDARLLALAKRFKEKFNLDGAIKLNANGKFRSVTVRRWKIFEDCSGHPKELGEFLSFLSSIQT